MNVIEIINKNFTNQYVNSIGKKLVKQNEYSFNEIYEKVTNCFGCQQSKDTIDLVICDLKLKGFNIKNN